MRVGILPLSLRELQKRHKQEERRISAEERELTTFHKKSDSWQFQQDLIDYKNASKVYKDHSEADLNAIAKAEAKRARKAVRK